MAKKSDRPRDMANDIIGAIRAGTSKWTKTRKTEERKGSSSERTCHTIYTENYICIKAVNL